MATSTRTSTRDMGAHTAKVPARMAHFPPVSHELSSIERQSCPKYAATWARDGVEKRKGPGQHTHPGGTRGVDAGDPVIIACAVVCGEWDRHIALPHFLEAA